MAREQKELKWEESEFWAASLVRTAESIGFSFEALEKRKVGFGRLLEMWLSQ